MYPCIWNPKPLAILLLKKILPDEIESMEALFKSKSCDELHNITVPVADVPKLVAVDVDNELVKLL